MYVCGCDVGARTGKAVLLDENGEIVSSGIVPFSRNPSDTAEQALQAALKAGGIAATEVAYSVATGFGQSHVAFAQETIPEISCHAFGAYSLDPQIRTVVDIGGQQCRAIRLTEDGGIEKFVMNDKCAAGTGTFLEDIAGVLELKVEDLGELSQQSTNEVKITNQCSVFALSEVISLVALKISVPDIVAGINASIANRVVSMVHRLGLQQEVLLSGGVAKNAGVVRALEKKLGISLRSVAADHQLLGALGAARLAKVSVAKRGKDEPARAAQA